MPRTVRRCELRDALRDRTEHVAVIREDAGPAVKRRENKAFALALEEPALGGNDSQQRCSCALTPQLFGALLHVVDSTGVEERGLGVFVHAAGEDLP